MKLKKINVKKFIETLTDNELKNVVGGYGPPGGTGSCAWWSGQGNDGACGISADVAEAMVKVNGGRWCCDSCGTASWYNDVCGSW